MFGAFQAIMPIVGWYLGDQFVTFMSRYDHWVIFFVLAVIGTKMIYEGIKGTGERKSARECESMKILLLLSLATSIDALAAGFGFAFLHSNIFVPAAIIGIVTFVLSFCGTALGDQIGSRFKRAAEVLGGSVLFLLGLNILIKHLSVL
jgi:putative Mn2+ efflux pump MntP